MFSFSLSATITCHEVVIGKELRKCANAGISTLRRASCFSARSICTSASKYAMYSRRPRTFALAAAPMPSTQHTTRNNDAYFQAEQCVHRCQIIVFCCRSLGMLSPSGRRRLTGGGGCPCLQRAVKTETRFGSLKILRGTLWSKLDFWGPKSIHHSRISQPNNQNSVLNCALVSRSKALINFNRTNPNEDGREGATLPAPLPTILSRAPS